MPKTLTGSEKVNADEVHEAFLNGDFDSLEIHEKLWARDHGLLSKAQEEELGNEPVTFGHGSPSRRVSNDPNVIAEQQLASSDLLNSIIEERAKELAKDMLLAAQQGNMAVGGVNTGRAGNAPVEVSPGVEPAFQPQGGDENFQEAPPYDQWDVKDLRAELRNRELHTSGTKAEMVTRLEENDASGDVEDDEPEE